LIVFLTLTKSKFMFNRIAYHIIEHYIVEFEQKILKNVVNINVKWNKIFNIKCLLKWSSLIHQSCRIVEFEQKILKNVGVLMLIERKSLNLNISLNKARNPIEVDIKKHFYNFIKYYLIVFLTLTKSKFLFNRIAFHMIEH
jgi:hypothetical protein